MHLLRFGKTEVIFISVALLPVFGGKHLHNSLQGGGLCLEVVLGGCSHTHTHGHSGNPDPDSRHIAIINFK